jgi:serine/threonine protein kinase
MHGVGQDKRMLYLYLDYVKGGSLMDLLQAQRRMPTEMARFYVAQVVQCFEYLHGRDTIYRDLKPENILCCLDGYIKLADFGFVKKLANYERTWTVCGTPEYMAPEIILSQGYRDAVDWYAVGIMLYELMVGQPPFTAQTPYEIF